MKRFFLLPFALFLFSCSSNGAALLQVKHTPTPTPTATPTATPTPTPQVLTKNASNILTVSAVLNGTVNPSGEATTYVFQYGLTTSYGTTSTPVSAGAGTKNVKVKMTVTGLAGGTTYHFRLQATGGGQTVNGLDKSFTTDTIPTPTPTPTATPTPTPPPDGVIDTPSTNVARIAGESVSFTGTGTESFGNTPLTYLWNFGVGSGISNSTSEDPGAKTFSNSGSFTVTFTVTNSASISDPSPATVVVTVAPSPSPTPTPDPTPTPTATPIVVTQAATGIGITNAILHGTVNPKGAATNYEFQWGTSISYGSTTGSTSAGSGTTAVSESGILSALTGNTLYHFRITATNGGGTANGSDLTFTTSPTPTPTPTPGVTTQAASGIGTTEMTLNGTVNPRGAPTTFIFEYGPTTSYGTSTTSVSAGTGTTDAPVAAHITGLSSGTTYHFRLKATNAGGTNTDGDLTASTMISTSIAPYPPGIWGLSGPSNTTIDPTLAANYGLVGLLVGIEWSAAEPSKGSYTFTDLDTKIRNAKAAGFHNITVGITDSADRTPQWLLTELTDEGQTIIFLDPGHEGQNFCHPIVTPLLWSTHWQARRIAMMQAMAAHYKNDPDIVATTAAFMNHHSEDWNITDTVGTLEGCNYLPSCQADGHNFTPCDIDINQPLQWTNAGWTRAKVRAIGEEKLAATAAAWGTKLIRLPIGGLDDALAQAGDPNPEPDPRGGSGNFTTLAYEITNWLSQQTFGNRFYITRNTSTSVWGPPPSPEPGPSGEQWLKWRINESGPFSGLQTVTSTSICKEDGSEKCRIAGNVFIGPGDKDLIMQAALNVFLSYDISFGEMWFQDACNPDWYAMTDAATRAMGGTPHTPP